MFVRFVCCAFSFLHFVSFSFTLQSNKAYGKTGKRDTHLEMERCRMGGRVGTLHFIRFPTSEMQAFMALAKSKGIASMATTICATGGGAHFFEEQFREVGKV